jgi:hypothetical protein
MRDILIRSNRPAAIERAAAKWREDAERAAAKWREWGENMAERARRSMAEFDAAMARQASRTLEGICGCPPADLSHI